MLSALLVLSLALSVAAKQCPQVQSCSSESKDVDPCCSPSAGLFLFRQRFEPDGEGDMGSWGIDGLEVLECETEKRSEKTYATTFTHEEIGSFCHRSTVMGGEAGIETAEREWAQSEVGEGVEEVWERAWNTAGRYISTLSPTCNKGSPGEQVPLFFHALHELHTKFPVATILADADIIPSADVTYALPELIEALSIEDHKPLVTCDNITLFSISYPFHVTGQFQSSLIHPANIGRQSNCPKDGIIYLPSTSILGQPTTTSYTWDKIYRPTPRPITMEHDEKRLVDPPSPEKELKFFKGSDEGREGKKGEKVEKQYWRDEL